MDIIFAPSFPCFIFAQALGDRAIHIFPLSALITSFVPTTPAVFPFIRTIQLHQYEYDDNFILPSLVMSIYICNESLFTLFLFAVFIFFIFIIVLLRWLPLLSFMCCLLTRLFSY